MIIGISGYIGAGKSLLGNIIQEQLNYPDPSKKYSGNNWELKSFAFKLKQIASILTGIPQEKFEDQEFKSSLLSKEWCFEDSVPGYGSQWQEMSVRTFLQKLGTDAVRNGLHPNAWVNALFVDYEPSVYWMCDRCDQELIHQLIEIPNRFKDQGYTENEWVCPSCKGEENEEDVTMVINDNPSKWIITDVRFPNEAKAIKDRGGVIIRVNRTKALSPKFTSEDGLQSVQFIEMDLGPKHPSETSLDDWEFDYAINNNGTVEELIEKVKEMIIHFKIINQ